MRDIMKTADAGKKNCSRRYSILCSEVLELMEMCDDTRGKFEAVLIAFHYGFELGRRAARAETRRSRA